MDEKLAHAPRHPGELTFALTMLLLALTALWLSYRISGFSGWSSAGSVPMGTSFFMVASAIVFIRGTLRKPPVETSPESPASRQFYEQIFPLRHMLFTAVIVAYMLLLEPLGFITSSFLYLMASSLVLGERRYVHMTILNVLSLATVYLVFQTAFSVVLPTGPVERLFQ